jgi:Putative restriction endonuclease
MVTTPTRINLRTRTKLDIAWEKLPRDFVLPDDPIDHIDQPRIASALSESLALYSYLSPSAFTCSDYAICTKLEGKTVVKSPDWVWVPATTVDKKEIVRSYTPHLEGAVPIVVIEFLFDTEGDEYSIKSSHPPGKWFYYEQVLQVPNYVIFRPQDGTIEVFSPDDGGFYKPVVPNENGLYPLADINLFLGMWEGTHLERTGYWLRWWNSDRQMLFWSEELTLVEKQRAERQRTKEEKQRADRAEQSLESAEQAQQNAIAKLTTLGLSLERIADALSLPISDVQQYLQKQGK